MSASDPPVPRLGLVTITQVAREAGVSVGTVSKALNDRGQLREATRQHVRAVAERLGFRPNDLAQSLLRGRSFTIGLISSDRFGRFSMPVLEGIEDALDPASVAVFLCKPTDDPVHERRHVEALLAKRVDGIIVTARRTDIRPALDLGGASVPVLYAYARTGNPDHPCLLPDDFGGGFQAGAHLAALGRRRIVHITGPERFDAVRQRRDGLRAALAEAGIGLSAADVLAGEWSEAWGRAAVARLLARPRPVDAIFCASDQIARGAVDALREHGRRVPEDVAVVGFDNWEIVAAETRPPLTTVDPMLSELGRQAGLRLLAMIDGQRVEGVARLPCRLVVRGSCGGAP